MAHDRWVLSMLTNDPLLTIPDRPRRPRRERLGRRICDHPAIRALRDSPGVTLAELVAAVAGLIAPELPGVHVVTVAVLLVRLGLHYLCRGI
jgi:hypothetical protein